MLYIASDGATCPRERQYLNIVIHWKRQEWRSIRSSRRGMNYALNSFYSLFRICLHALSARSEWRIALLWLKLILKTIFILRRVDLDSQQQKGNYRLKSLYPLRTTVRHTLPSQLFRREVLCKHKEFSFKKVQGVIIQTTGLFISTAVRTSIPTYVCML